MGAADRSGSRLGQAEVLHLTLVDEVLQGARNILNRHVRIDTVLVEEIDHVGPQSLEGCLGNFLDVLRAAVQAGVVVQVEAELRSDRDSVAERRERLTNQLLVRS